MKIGVKTRMSRRNTRNGRGDQEEGVRRRVEDGGAKLVRYGISRYRERTNRKRKGESFESRKSSWQYWEKDAVVACFANALYTSTWSTGNGNK